MNLINSLKLAIGAKHGSVLLTTAFIAFIASMVTLQLLSVHVWDDAYMFVRYADSFLATGTLSFNPGGDATYGLTSLAFLSVVVPIRMIFPDSPTITMLVASTLCGFLFIGTLITLLLKCVTSKSTQLRYIAVIIVLFSLAYAIQTFSTHFVTGMDTMFVLTFLTVYIFISKWHEQSLSPLSVVLTGCLGGLAFAVRPDLMIYSAILPVTSILFPSSRKARLMAVAVLIITGIVLLLQIVIYARYLNSPLPLPFYAKGLRLYGKAIHDLYRFVPQDQLYDYVLSLPLLFSVIAIPFILDPKGWWKKFSSIDKGLLFATIVFLGYYLLFVLQIMYYCQRFYYPTLPALAFLAAQSIAFIGEKLSPSGAFSNLSMRTFLIGVFVFSLIILLPPGRAMTEEALTFLRDRGGRRYSSYVLASYKERRSENWFCLDKFSSLPDDLTMATTEIGHPLGMNPNKVIIDIAGLNETRIAHEGFSAETFFENYQPDLIYLPHPHYEELLREITDNPFFISNYEYFSSSLLSSRLGVAIKKDSKYYVPLREIVKDNCPGI